MAAPSSQLRAVQTYQKSGLAYFQNLNCAVATANTKFKEFNKLPAQLGSTVTFDQQVRYNFVNSLAVASSFQGTNQIVNSLTVNQQGAVPFSFSDQDYIFNAEEFIDSFHSSATAELSANVEANIWQNTVQSSTYRTYYSAINGTSTKVMADINSRTQLAQALAKYRNFGAPKGMMKGYLPDLAVPPIIGADLSRFTPILNDKEVLAWDLGSFDMCDFFKSNLLPIQYAGTIGNEGEAMTVVSISPDGTTIVASGVTASTATLKANDIVEFDNNGGLRFLTYTGHQTSGQTVQVRVVADATANGSGQITFTVSPALISDPTDSSRNINMDITAGMTMFSLPDHRCGLITGGNPLYVAMPQLPDQSPYESSYEADQDTAVSLRVYYGVVPFQNERGFVVDCIWGSKLVADYAMRVAFPVNV